jgi:hypothetical protein
MRNQASDTNGRPATERAEELLDRLGEGVGRVVARAKPRVLMLAALAREEAEDIWAEAQHMRAQRRQASSESKSRHD